MSLHVYLIFWLTRVRPQKGCGSCILRRRPETKSLRRYIHSAFSMTAAAHYHKPGVLKQHVFSYSSKFNFTREDSSHSPSQSLQGRILFLASSGSSGCMHVLTVGPSRSAKPVPVQHPDATVTLLFPPASLCLPFLRTFVMAFRTHSDRPR